MEPLFRQLGLPTKLNMQKIELESDVFVCKDQQVLTVEQCKLLKLLGHKMGKFSLKVLMSRSQKGKINITDQGRVHLAKQAE